MSEIFEVVIFTASLSQYANPLINRLDKMNIGFSQLYREHWTFHKGLYFVKDLSKLGRELKDVLIVDNSPSAYLFQPENAIPINSWYSNTKDRELFKLIPLLTKMAKLDDVRIKDGKNSNLSTQNSPSSPIVTYKNGTKLSETPGRIRPSKSKRILVKSEDLKVNLATDRSNRTKSHRQYYRPTMKNTNINQLFQPNQTGKSWNRKLSEK